MSGKMWKKKWHKASLFYILQIEGCEDQYISALIMKIPNWLFKSKANESYCLYNSGPMVRHYASTYSGAYGSHTIGHRVGMHTQGTVFAARAANAPEVSARATGAARPTLAAGAAQATLAALAAAAALAAKTLPWIILSVGPVSDQCRTSVHWSEHCL